MSFIHERQARCYCCFLLGLILFIFGAGIWLASGQTEAVREMLLAHDNAVATSLLEQGVSREIIATALSNTDTSSEGKQFLAVIGLSDSTDASCLPYASFIQEAMLPPMLGTGLVLSISVIIGAVLFLCSRERLYKNSQRIIRNYIDGDYTTHLPQTGEGTVYQMLSSVDHLATMLQARNDTDRKTKEFLKNTISDISHQLKTPLAALMMYQEIMESEPDNPDTIKAFCVKMENALKRMEQLIQSMLKITRLDAGSILFKKDHYNLSDLIYHAINELTIRANNENKELVTDGDAEQAIFCDKEWTSEAIGNIVKNALDHTDSGGRICISWERTPAMVRICIADDGHGIAPEDIHHIFKRFYRSKKTLETQGTGLGLPLAKAIVEGQGGILSVQSEPMQGTSFTLSFLTEF